MSSSILGSGPRVLQNLSGVHRDPITGNLHAHSAILEKVINAHDTRKEDGGLCVDGATEFQILVFQIGGKDAIAFTDNGPGPRLKEPGSTEFKPAPSHESVRAMLRPGMSYSAEHACKVGQAGQGELGGMLGLGKVVTYATHNFEKVRICYSPTPSCPPFHIFHAICTSLVGVGAAARRTSLTTTQPTFIPIRCL